MNLGTLRSAVQRRGFQDVSTTDIDQAINDACVELDSRYLWPYREKSVTGTAPVQITDLGVVDEVLDLSSSSLVLAPASWDELAAVYGDLSIAGAPVYWYTATPLGVLEVATYPVSSSHTIGVQYWALSATLSGDSDTPLAPAAWHSLLVDMAAAALYPDGETPVGLTNRIERRLGVMVNALMDGYGPSEVGGDGVDS